MTYILDENLGELIREHRGLYLMVNAVSKRVRQLQRGERALAYPPDGSREAVKIAIQEFLDDKLKVTEKTFAKPAAEAVEQEPEQEQLTEEQDDTL